MTDNEMRERLDAGRERCLSCRYGGGNRATCCVNNSGCTDQPHRCVNMLVDNDYYYWTASAAEYAFGNHAYNMLRSKAAAAPPCPWFTRRRE